MKSSKRSQASTPRRRSITLPTQEEVRAVRNRIKVTKMTLGTGSVWCLLDDHEFRLQKMNSKEATSKFIVASSPFKKLDLLLTWALCDEAFEQFENARQEARRAHSKLKAKSRSKKVVDPRQLTLSPEPA